MFDHNPLGKKQRNAPVSYLARPRFGYSKGLEKKKRSRRSSLTNQRMEFRKKPDYADTAYKEALSKLRTFLADSYIPRKPMKDLDSAGEETDNQSILSGASKFSKPSHIHYRYSPNIHKKYLNLYYTPTRSTFTATPRNDNNKIDPKCNPQNPQLVSFIERQEEYIEQLERESKFCRDELSQLLRKVKEVISENDNLHDKQKSSLIRSVFNRLDTETETETETEGVTKSPKKSKKFFLEGPTIVFESRISELEAQLTQTRIDLRKAMEENESFRRKISDGSLGDAMNLDGFKKQTETLQREKAVLQETITKLQSALAQIRDKEHLTSDQVKRSLDAAEQAQYERNAAELEIRRLKDELERQHEKLRNTINEQSRRIAEERSAIERRYSQQIEQLTNELGVQWESTSKLQLELDKQRRETSDSRREIAQKQAYIDELKKEMQTKIAALQSDIGMNGAEKGALEQEISTLQLTNERNERQAKQEVARLQAEMQSLRQRLDRADADLIHSRRENIRTSEQVAALEKEINMRAALSEEKGKRSEAIALPPPKRDDRENELTSMIKDMEVKHAATVAELESMVQSQNQLMEKLSGECQMLTTKLEEASTRHKEEIRELQSNLEYLSNRVNSHTNYNQPPVYVDEGHFSPVAQVPPAISASRRNSKLLSRTNSMASINPIASPTDNRRQSIIIQEPLPLSRRGSILYQQPEVPRKYSVELYEPQEQSYPNDGQYAAEDAYDQGYQYVEDPNQQYDYGYDQQPYVTQEEYDEQNQPQYITQEEYDRQYGQFTEDAQYDKQYLTQESQPVVSPAKETAENVEVPQDSTVPIDKEDIKPTVVEEDKKDLQQHPENVEDKADTKSDK